MKKLIRLTVVLAIVLSVVFAISITASAADLTYGDFTYTLSDGKATITGLSPTYIGELTIPSKISGAPVVAIGDYAFRDHTGIKSAVIPKSVTTIGNSAFYGCSGMTSLTIGSGVTSIGHNAFAHCSGLKALTIPDSVTSMGTYAFRNCTRLASVTIGNGLTEIPSHGFYECSGLSTLKLGSKVQTIRDYAFCACSSLKSITWNSKITAIGDSAFKSCTGLTTVKIPNTVTTIGSAAFYDCSGMTDLTIGSKVATIENYAFGNCGALKAITIPNSVKSLGLGGFQNCASAVTIKIGSGLTQIPSDAFSNCNALTTLTMGPNVTSIGGYAFQNAHVLTTIKWGTSLLSIGNCAFQNSISLKSLMIPGTVTSVGASAFGGCTALTDLILGYRITSLGNYAFAGCTALTTVELPKYLTDLHIYAFQKCTGLKTVYLPEGIQNINTGVFEQTALTDVHYAGSASDWTYVHVGNWNGPLTGATFHYDSALKHAAPVIKTQPKSVAVVSGKTAKATVTASGTGLMYEWYYAKKGSTEYLGTSAFKGNSYSITMNADRNGRKVYCVVTDVYGNSVKTKTVSLNKKTPLKITAQPKSVGVPNGSTAKVSFKVQGDGLTYKWYYAAAGSTKYTYTSSFKGTSYSVTMNEARDGRKVYCVITDKYGDSVQTNTVSLNLKTPLKITQQPKSITSAAGTTGKVTFKVQGDGLTYKWYYAKKGSTKYTYTSTFTGNTYKMSMTADRSGRKVYCVVTDRYGESVKTNTVTLTTKTPLKITAQPTSVIVGSGDTAKVTFKVQGDGLTYKWYYANAGSSTYTRTTSFKSNSYSITMSAARDGRKVYCVVTDKYGNSVKTNTVILAMG